MDQNIHVLVRVRPLNYKETHNGAQQCISTQQNTVILDTKKEFTFDQVLGVDSTQEQVYSLVGEPLSKAALSGLNCCVFAYGQTGAGKTYTMQGKADEVPKWGLQPRVFANIFSSLDPQSSWTIKCTFLEIYNEQLIDLLNDSRQLPLTLREDSKRVYVENLQEVSVANFNDTIQVMMRGLANRHVSSTSMNLESSRSHSIFTMSIESKTAVNGVFQLRKSKLNFVDLAGSERQKQTSATGDRLKEAANINKSLTTLGLVINSLAETNRKFIPYRDSKLTFLLRESLGGNSKTFMIASISAANTAFSETLSTLKFAQRAKQIKNQAVVNEEVGGSVETLKAEIRRLKSELMQFTDSKLNASEALTSQIQTLNYQLSVSELYQEQLNQQVLQLKEYYEARISEITITSTLIEDQNHESKQSAELKKKLDEKNDRIKELLIEQQMVKGKYNELLIEKQQMQHQISSQNEYRIQLEADILKYQTQIVQFETDLEQLQEEKLKGSTDSEKRIEELSYQMALQRDQMDTDLQTIEFQNSELERLNEIQEELQLKREQQLQLEGQCTQKDEQLKDYLKQMRKMKRVVFTTKGQSIKQKTKRQKLEDKTLAFLNKLTQQTQQEEQTSIEDSLYSLELGIQALQSEKEALQEQYKDQLIQYESLQLQQQELQKQLEENKINQEAIQKYEELRIEFSSQKDKLHKFLDSYDIVNQKLILKENEVMKLRSELKLEQTQRAKSLEEIDKLRTAKVQLTNKAIELEQTIQQLQLNQQSDQKSSTYKVNLKMNEDLMKLQRQNKQLQDDKDLLQRRYEEKLMYSSDTNKVRKEISSISQLKTNLDNTMKENKELKDQLIMIDSFFTQMNLKRYCSHYAEGQTSEKVKKYFDYLEKCEQEFQLKQYQIKTNMQLLHIEQANCNLIKEENRMLKMQMQNENCSLSSNKKMKI